MYDGTKFEICRALDYDAEDLVLEYHRHNYKMYSTIDEPEYMIRVFENNILPLAHQKFTSEGFVLEIMANYPSIPTPELIKLAFTETGTCILVMEKLNGVPLHETWNYLSTDHRIKIAGDFGEMLNQLHQIEQDGYGIPGDYIESWYNFINDRLLRNIKVLEPYLPHNIAEKIHIHHREWLTALSSTTPVLVHGDINPHNILISQVDEEPIISGIIDWEWSIAGNPLYDLVNIESLFYNSTEILNSFYQGYGSIPNRLSWEKERRLYLLDRFLLAASYDVMTDNFTRQQQELLRFILHTILK